MYENQSLKKGACAKSLRDLKYFKKLKKHVISVEESESTRENARENEKVKRFVYIDATVRLRSHASRTAQYKGRWHKEATWQGHSAPTTSEDAR